MPPTQTLLCHYYPECLIPLTYRGAFVSSPHLTVVLLRWWQHCWHDARPLSVVAKTITLLFRNAWARLVWLVLSVSFYVDFPVHTALWVSSEALGPCCFSVPWPKHREISLPPPHPTTDHSPLHSELDSETQPCLKICSLGFPDTQHHPEISSYDYFFSDQEAIRAVSFQGLQIKSPVARPLSPSLPRHNISPGLTLLFSFCSLGQKLNLGTHTSKASSLTQPHPLSFCSLFQGPGPHTCEQWVGLLSYSPHSPSSFKIKQ